MKTQTIEFAVQKENGIVTKIGKSTVYQPKTGSKDSGGSMECRQDVPAMDTLDNHQKG